MSRNLTFFLISCPVSSASNINAVIANANALATDTTKVKVVLAKGNYSLGATDIIMKSNVILTAEDGERVAYKGMEPGQQDKYGNHSKYIKYSGGEVVPGDFYYNPLPSCEGDTYTPITVYNSSGVNLFWDTPGHGIRAVGAENFVIDNLKITGAGSIKISTGTANRSNILISNCLIQNTLNAKEIGAYTFYANKGTGFTNIGFKNCIAYETSGAGFLCRGDEVTDWVDEVNVDDCYSYGCGMKNRSWNWAPGFDIAERNTVKKLRMNRCQADFCFESGVHFEPVPVEDAVLTDCIWQYNGQKPGDFVNNEKWRPTGLGFGAGVYVCGTATLKVTLVNCHSCGNALGNCTGRKC